MMSKLIREEVGESLALLVWEGEGTAARAVGVGHIKNAV